MKNPLILTACSVLALTGAIGCSPSGSAPAQKTTGVLTGFGSVIVNGVHFDTSGASILIDGEPASLSDLDVGMVISVTGDGRNDAGEPDFDHDDDDDGEEDEEDNALKIETDSEVEGEVLSSAIASGSDTGTMNVMGQNVHITADTVFDSDVEAIVSIDQVAAGHIVEISGFSDGNGEIFATRVEVEAVDFATYLAEHSDGMEVQANIANLDAVAKTFTLGSLVVDYSTADVDADDDGSDDGDDEGLSNGFFVEVESTAGIVNGVLIASEVEREDDGEHGHQGEANDHYDIEGIITTDFNGSSFTINGVTVIVNGGTFYENTSAAALKAGTEIEVEGIFNASGDLIAMSIELEEEADQELSGQITHVSLNPGTVNVGTITVAGNVLTVNNETLMKDEAGANPVKMFNLTYLSASDFVEVEYFTDSASGKLIAVEVERDD